MQDIREVAPGLANPGRPLPDVATAGQPDGDHLERLAGAGYRTVLDLRKPGENRGLDEPGAVRRAGMEYVSIPVGYKDIDDGTFDRFRELMSDQGRRPFLVHCRIAQ